MMKQESQYEFFQEKEDLSFGISEEGEIPDQQESDAFSDARYYLRQQQRVSNVEMQRRSHETESRLWQRVKKLRSYSYTICFV